MIYYKDEHEFYNGIQDLAEYLSEYEPDEKALAILREKCPNGVTVNECELMPIHQFEAGFIKDRLQDMIPEENWPEDAECSENQVDNALDKFLKDITPALENLNRSMPELWYPTDGKTHYSLEELEEMIS